MPDSFLTRSRLLLAESWDDALLVFARRADAELPLARFIFEKRQLIQRIVDGVNTPLAKWKAFEPPRNLKLSVFETKEHARTSPGIWQLDPLRAGKPAIAAAHFWAKDAYNQHLEPRVDNRPAHHVTIRGWPKGEDKEYDRLAAATELAAAATVVMR